VAIRSRPKARDRRRAKQEIRQQSNLPAWLVRRFV